MEPAEYHRRRVAAVLGFTLILRRRRRRRHCRERKLWSREWLLRRESERLGSLRLCRELEAEDHHSFANFSRLFPDQFHQLLEMVTPRASVQKSAILQRSYHVNSRSHDPVLSDWLKRPRRNRSRLSAKVDVPHQKDDSRRHKTTQNKD